MFVFNLLKGSWEIIKELVGTKPNGILKGDLLKLICQVGLFIPKQIGKAAKAVHKKGVCYLH